MTMLERLLAQPIAQDLGWTLLHFLWQGALIAILFGIAISVARWKSATIRYALACGALALMAAAPIATFARLRAVPEAASEAYAPSAAGAADSTLLLATETAVAASPISPRRFASWLQAQFPALQPWMVLAWSLGVAVLSVRYLGGWAAAQRLKGRRIRPAAEDWQSTLDRLAARLRVSRPVRLLESASVKVPTAIGAWKPVILVPAAALTGIAPSHLEALIAHELAHIRRHDYLVNLLQSAVETLLFYHPAVWWVSRRARVERENCCDDLAIRATGNARLFARALADLEERRSAPFRLQTAADGGVLRQRVLRLIGKPERSEPLPRQLAAVFTLALLFGTGAAVRFSSPQIDGTFTPAFSALSAYDSSEDGTGLNSGDPEDACGDCDSPSEGVAATAAANVETVVAPEAARKSSEDLGQSIREGVGRAVQAGVSGRVIRSIAESVATSVTSSVAGSLAEGVSGGLAGGVVGGVAGGVAQTVAQSTYDAVVVALEQEASEAQEEAKPQAAPKKAEPGRGASLSVEQLIAFKVHGVTPEFIRQVEGLGRGRPSPDDLIALRIHGVTPEYIRSVERTWGPLSLEQIVSMKIHGLTPEYAEEMKKTGLKGLSFDELMSMKIHGVTPEYIRQAQSVGFGILDADQIVSLKIHGVSAQDAAKWKALGMRGVDFDQVLSAKIHGVTPQFVEEMRKLGFTSLDMDEIVAMKIHGVTPEFVAKLRELGYKVTPEDATALRIHGVTADSVAEYKSAEPNLTLEEMVELKINGIRPAELKKMLRDGKLSVDDLIEDEEDPEEKP